MGKTNQSSDFLCPGPPRLDDIKGQVICIFKYTLPFLYIFYILCCICAFMVIRLGVQQNILLEEDREFNRLITSSSRT